MILWTSRIYVGDKIKKKKDKVIASINNKEVSLGVYCIAFASNQDNLFDIIDANELLFPHYRRAEIHIVGLAKGKEEALTLVQSMLIEIFDNTGRFDVRTYFM